MGLKALQANLHRSRTADALLAQIVTEHKIDIVLISEQYKAKESGTWIGDDSKTAAIWLPRDSKCQVTSSGKGNCFVHVNIEGMTVMSCYLTPSDNTETFQAKLNAIEDKGRELHNSLIVAGDFNSKAPEWGSRNTDSRGRRVLEMAARLGLTVMNTPTATTFRRPGNEATMPDLTFASESIAGRIQSWQVLEDYNGSDHQYISFTIVNLQNHSVNNGSTEYPKGWNVDRLNHERLLAEFDRRILATNGATNARGIVEHTMYAITKACDAAMPRKSRGGRKPVYWWNDEIARAREACIRSRRQFTRAHRRGDATAEHEAYKRAKKELGRAITRSKKEKWAQLCADVNNDPWGLGYKLVMKKLGAKTSASCMDAETMDDIVKKLFPTHPVRTDEESARSTEAIPFTVDELKEAAASLKNNKAPGPDGIPVEVLKCLASNRPQAMLLMYNTCLTEGVFPECWKIQRLVLIDKAKNNVSATRSFRPLCMLDTSGKLFEKMIKPRLSAAIAEAGDLSERQHGFRKGRSTIGAIREVMEAATATQQGNHYSRPVVVLMTLDVENAFNTANWQNILTAIDDKFHVPEYLSTIIRSYLRDRTLLYNTSSGAKTMQITAGAAQGSILGPDLWNAVYDDIFRIDMPDDTFLVGFADDVAAVITARNTIEAQRKVNQVMIRVQLWMTSQGLKLATEKTEILLITRRQIPLQVEMRANDTPVTTQTAVKYLGIKIDSKLTFKAHIEYVTEKASKVTSWLSRLMANVNGPLPSKRKLLMGVCHSTLLYGCEIWADVMSTEARRKAMTRVQRTAALRIVSAYRTVSAAATLVIAGVMPIDLMAKERKELYELKRTHEYNTQAAKELKESMMSTWQDRWRNDNRGRWTARLIPHLIEWLERKHGEVNYYLTQLLTGHGYFRRYLHRMGKCRDARCIYGDAENDDAEHTFFECVQWHTLRSELFNAVGALTAENIVQKMIESEDSWNLISIYTEKVLKLKKTDLDREITNERTS